MARRLAQARVERIAVRETRAVAARKAVNLPTAKYRVLYADPPWSYNDKADDGSTRRAGGAARQRPHRGVQRALRRARSLVWALGSGSPIRVSGASESPPV